MIKLVPKVNNINIDTGKFILKSHYDADETELENEIPDISGLASKTALATVENKIPRISNLATKTALSTVENKIPDVSNLATKAALTTIENKIPDGSTLVKKSYYDTKIKNVENKCITTTEFNKLATDAFNTRTVQTHLVKKTDFNNKLSDLNRKIMSNKMKDISIAK